MLDQWVMSKHLPDVPHGPKLIALHERCIKKKCENFLQNNQTGAVTHPYLLPLTTLCKNSEEVQCKQF